MLKIRLIGTEDEIVKAIEKISSVFEVTKCSKIHTNTNQTGSDLPRGSTCCYLKVSIVKTII